MRRRHIRRKRNPRHQRTPLILKAKITGVQLGESLPGEGIAIYKLVVGRGKRQWDLEKNEADFERLYRYLDKKKQITPAEALYFLVKSQTMKQSLVRASLDLRMESLNAFIAAMASDALLSATSGFKVFFQHPDDDYDAMSFSIHSALNSVASWRHPDSGRHCSNSVSGADPAQQPYMMERFRAALDESTEPVLNDGGTAVNDTSPLLTFNRKKSRTIEHHQVVPPSSTRSLELSYQSPHEVSVAAAIPSSRHCQRAAHVRSANQNSASMLSLDTKELHAIVHRRPPLPQGLLLSEACSAQAIATGSIQRQESAACTAKIPSGWTIAACAHASVDIYTGVLTAHGSVIDAHHPSAAAPEDVATQIALCAHEHPHSLVRPAAMNDGGIAMVDFSPLMPLQHDEPHMFGRHCPSQHCIASVTRHRLAERYPRATPTVSPEGSFNLPCRSNRRERIHERRIQRAKELRDNAVALLEMLSVAKNGGISMGLQRNGTASRQEQQLQLFRYNKYEQVLPRSEEFSSGRCSALSVRHQSKQKEAQVRYIQELKEHRNSVQGAV